MGKLKTILKIRGESLLKLSFKTDLAFKTIYKIDSDPMINLEIKTIQKIYQETGISAEEYLDWPCLKLKRILIKS